MLEITAATVTAANTDTLRKMASQAKIQNIRSFKTAELREMLLGCIRVWNSEPTKGHVASANIGSSGSWPTKEEKEKKAPAKKVTRKPSTHAHCTHPATKAARAKCRRSRRAEEIAGAQLAAAGR